MNDVEIFPTRSIKIMGGTTIEVGCILDHSHDSLRGFALRLLSYVRDLSASAGRALDGLSIVEPAEDNGQDEDEMVTECMDLLGNILSDSEISGDVFSFEVEDNSLYLRRASGVGFRIETVPHDFTGSHVTHMEYDGEVFTSAVSDTVFKVEVFDVDEDGDEGDTLGTFGATWAGGQACYLNLYSSIGDAEDIAPNVRDLYVAGAAEALHIGDPAEERSAGMARTRLADWCQTYADGAEGMEWAHDAGYYGFPC